MFPALADEHPSMFPAGRFTLEAFRWARSTLSSRCFSEDVLKNFLTPGGGAAAARARTTLTPEESALLRPDCPAVLCPLLDLTNHDPNTVVQVGVCDEHYLGVAVAAPTLSGGEILNNYGNCKNNLQLLLGHGFCVRGNPVDCLPLRLGVPATDSQERHQLIHKIGLKVDEVHDLSMTTPLPPRLLAVG